MLPLATSAFTNASIGASLATLMVAPGGGPKGAGSADAVGSVSSRAMKEAAMRVICELTLLHCFATIQTTTALSRHCDERSDDVSAVARRAKAEAIQTVFAAHG